MESKIYDWQIEYYMPKSTWNYICRICGFCRPIRFFPLKDKVCVDHL